MSSNHQEKKDSEARAGLIFNALGLLGLMLLFGVIVGVAYLPNRAQRPDEDVVEARMRTLSEVQASQKKLVSSYEWINKEDGVVRIPIERSMELVVTRLKKKE